MSKWEYCSIHNRNFVVLFVDGSNIQSIKKDKAKGEFTDWEAELRLIAQLGQDGWEMVNFERIGDYFVYWFKRPIDK